MTPPNVNTLWGRVIVDELAKAGVETVCLSPGSRCTPLTVAVAEHDHIMSFSHLDERSAAYFALGRARRTGTVTPLVCTSGTAAANFHPAVIEADHGRVPMLLLTADRPPELHHSGANQTIDQDTIYDGAVRHARTLPEPEAADRKLRSLRTTICRAVGIAETERGPVHLNVPFRKPLEPTVETDEISPAFGDRHALAVGGREGPFVTIRNHPPPAPAGAVDELTAALHAAERGLLVVGPADQLDPARVAAFAGAAGLPILADPVSGLRFGPHIANDDCLVCGGYDSYLATDVPPPDLVLRLGGAPTSKSLRQYLCEADCRQVVLARTDWPEASFTATDLIRADPTALLTELEATVDRPGGDWLQRFAALEEAYWNLVDVPDLWEGGILADAARLAPDPSTLVVSNSMPVRDLDRYGQPRDASITALANRGASGIDGITSTALGAGSAVEEPLLLVTGDLAFYHDTNGLLAVERCGVDATIVVINNDGGGIFHLLPIAEHETFERYFQTPHGLDFAEAASLHGLSFSRTDDRETFRERLATSLAQPGAQVIEVQVDAAESHQFREQLHETVTADLADGEVE